jgi:hypothetical protein
MNSPKEMTPDAKRVLVNYIRDAADKMGMKDWSFDISARDPLSGAIASTEIWGDSHTATVWIGKTFWKYGPRMQREVICHELVHWHTDKLYRAAREVYRNVLGREAFELSLAALKQVHELTVDGIAAAWARTLPLIDWTDTTSLYHEYEEEHADDEEAQPKGAIEE